MGREARANRRLRDELSAWIARLDDVKARFAAGERLTGADIDLLDQCGPNTLRYLGIAYLKGKLVRTHESDSAPE